MGRDLGLIKDLKKHPSGRRKRRSNRYTIQVKREGMDDNDGYSTAARVNHRSKGVEVHTASTGWSERCTSSRSGMERCAPGSSKGDLPSQERTMITSEKRQQECCE